MKAVHDELREKVASDACSPEEAWQVQGELSEIATVIEQSIAGLTRNGLAREP